MPEPTVVILTQTIQNLLDELDDELHGRKSAFAEAQKIRHINKAVNGLWKLFKTLHRGYFVVSSQRTTSANDDYFADLDTTTLEYDLPKNFAEMRFIEVLDPKDYAGLQFVHTPMSAPLFQTERWSQNSGPTADSAVAVPGHRPQDRRRGRLSRPETGAINIKTA